MPQSIPGFNRLKALQKKSLIETDRKLASFGVNTEVEIRITLEGEALLRRESPEQRLLSDSSLPVRVQDNTVYGYDIRGYYLATGTQFPICTNPSQQACPEVSGNIVVWTDDRNGNGDIYGYDLSTKAEFLICTDEAYQGWAEICDNIVVWEDERNGNSGIYGYDLSTGTEFPICTERHEQEKPRVSGNIVVWEDSRHSWWEEELNYWFNGYNLSTGTEFPIFRYEPIFGMGLQDFDGDITVYDMQEEEGCRITGLKLP